MSENVIPYSEWTSGGNLRMSVLAGPCPNGLTFLVTEPTLELGSKAGAAVSLQVDTSLREKHMTLSRTDDGWSLQQHGPVNRVYRKVTTQTPLAAGTCFRVGEQVLRLEAVPSDQDVAGPRYLSSPLRNAQYFVQQLLSDGRRGAARLLSQGVLHIGSNVVGMPISGDRTLDDAHCTVFRAEDGGVWVADNDSVNGVWVELADDAALASGDLLMVGQTILKVEL